VELLTPLKNYNQVCDFWVFYISRAGAEKSTGKDFLEKSRQLRFFF